MTSRSHYKRYLPHAVGGVVVLGVLGGLLAFINHMLNADTPIGKKTVQQITLLQPPPPPPPPPKDEEPPPEPEVVEEETPDPEPQEADASADDVPPGADLGLDADGGAGGDAFGLVGRKGGRDLIGGASGRLAWFDRVLVRDIQDQLSEKDCVRKRAYSAVLKIWFRQDGVVERVVQTGSSGNKEIDACLREAAKDIRAISERPPEEAVSPVSVKVTSRS
jgi:protein TonB